MADPRYASWLSIADQLEELHACAYGPRGPFSSFSNSPIRPSGKEAAEWLRQKAQAGGWYWWDRSTLRARADEPLRSLERVIGDGGGRYDDSAEGAAVVAQIKAIRQRVADLARQ